MRTRTFPLGYESPPLTENQRMHHMARARTVKEVRALGRLLGSQMRGCGHVEVLLEWWVPDNRKRDEDNIVPTLKALCDGLVDAGVVPDDTPEYMTKRMPRIHFERGARKRLTLTVSEIRPNLD